VQTQRPHAAAGSDLFSPLSSSQARPAGAEKWTLFDAEQSGDAEKVAALVEEGYSPNDEEGSAR